MNPFELLGMFFLMFVFAGTGHLYSVSLNRLLSESGVYAAGTVKQMMAEKDIDWTLRGLTLLD